MTNKYYKFLPQLPHPPKELLEQIDLTARPKTNTLGSLNQRHLKNWNGRDFAAAQNVRRKFNDEFETWVRENITSDFLDAGLCYVDADENKSSTGAHTDDVRDYVIIYNILTGGPDATLCFWQENGHPIKRPRLTMGEDLAKLTLLESVVAPSHQWYLLDSKVMHSVENLVSARINLQVSLRENLWK